MVLFVQPACGDNVCLWLTEVHLWCCLWGQHVVAGCAGALAGLIQGPRATSLTDGVDRPQMSYSLPAQLPDPDQHMHEVYLAAQAAAAGNTTQVRQQYSNWQLWLCEEGRGGNISVHVGSWDAGKGGKRTSL